MDEVRKRALKAVKELRRGFLDREDCREAFSEAYKADVKYVRSAVQIEGIGVGLERMTRPNGYDKGDWEGWEVGVD